MKLKIGSAQVFRQGENEQSGWSNIYNPDDRNHIVYLPQISGTL